MKLSGIINHKIFAEGTKSECRRPYIFLENGSQILIYKKNDNPFENKGFTDYEGKEVVLEGKFESGLIIVENIKESLEKEDIKENLE